MHQAALGEHYLTDARQRMRALRDVGERTLTQLPESRQHHTARRKCRGQPPDAAAQANQGRS
ncbi:hypothetical protein [Deinococcus radiophilus]|uniref:Uncharacterized protein n=1 Tax=Deinococcus radiophilus TaxID=32062 RepID=A0A3S0KB22_9DEIO|nr:hypothetical protein [Deinococcus radiophilus]RTR26666.1 hypothetical protein EJ104_07800 [Deinococcus radiophilus]UFA51006.1 DUF1572 domain-containing protein [Deinococcus radiophilus]